MSIVVQGANPHTSSDFRMMTLEQRRKRVDEIGTRIIGSNGRVLAFGDVTLPTISPDRPATRRAQIPDYTTPARAELDLLIAREGYSSFAAWRKANPRLSEESAWLEEQRAKGRR